MPKYLEKLGNLLILIGLAISVYFGCRSLGANISWDDAGFIFGITSGSPSTWIDSMLAYVPGRNLHIFWQVILFSVTGGSKSDLITYHLIQAGFFGLVGLFVFLILKRGGASKFVSVYLGLLVLVFPLFSSILLWANSLPQHIISSLLFLVGIFLVLPDDQRIFEKRPVTFSILAWFAITLSMFTYDQSAATAALLTFVLLLKSAFRVRLKWIPIHTTPLLSWLMAFSLSGYFYIFFSGRGTGDNLTFGSKTVSRLIENLMIPTKVMRKFQDGSASGKSYFYFEPSVILWILALFCLLLILISVKVLFVNSTIPFKLGLHSIQLSVLFLVLAFSAYLPAAIWYVAPRHLYFPALLFFISAGFLIDYISFRIPIDSKLRLFSFSTALIVYLGAAFGFNGQLNEWMKRDLFRSNFYQELAPALEKQGLECVVISRVLNNSDVYLYSEVLNTAIEYYNGRSIGDSNKCASAPTELADHVFKCYEGNLENWAELTAYSAKKDARNFQFDFVKIC